MSIIFPLTELLDPAACQRWFEAILWPQGRVCPRCGAREHLRVQSRRRAERPDYQCQHCGRVFNLLTGTVFAGTHRALPELYAIVRGVAQGVSTNQLSQELGCDYKHLLNLRHKLQDWIAGVVGQSPPVRGPVAEVDELYQNAGEKRRPAHGSQRSAPAAGQPAAGPWLVGQRPGAGGRGGRTGAG